MNLFSSSLRSSLFSLHASHIGFVKTRSSLPLPTEKRDFPLKKVTSSSETLKGLTFRRTPSIRYFRSLEIKNVSPEAVSTRQALKDLRKLMDFTTTGNFKTLFRIDWTSGTDGHSEAKRDVDQKRRITINISFRITEPILPEEKLEEKEIEKIERELHQIEEQINTINRKLEREETTLKFSDIVQEAAGAALLAFPFAASEDVWELSRKMSISHALFLLFLTVIGLYVVIKFGKIGNWKIQNLGGFLPLRLLTITVISLTVSALSLLILGVYPSVINNPQWFIKAAILVFLFSTMGSFGLDAAK